MPFEHIRQYSPKRRSILLLDRYILRQLGIALACLTAGSAGLILLTQSLHFIPMVVQHGLPLRAFLHLATLMLPSVVFVILPVATFLSVLFIYQRLMTDRELTVMRTAGLSPLALARPGLICGLVSSLICYLLSLWIAPAATHSFHRYEYEIRNRVAAFLLEDDVFTQVSPTMMLYIRAHNSENEFYGVLIEDSRDSRHPATILAERGTMFSHNGVLQLVLYHGSRQEIDRQSGMLALLNFDQDSIALGDSHTNDIAARDAAERPLYDLFYPPAGTDPRLRNKLTAEAWHRLTAPLAGFTYGLVALVCILQGGFSRHSTMVRPLLATGFVICLIILALALKSLAERHPQLVSLLWVEALLPAMIGMGILVREHMRGRPV